MRTDPCTSIDTSVILEAASRYLIYRSKSATVDATLSRLARFRDRRRAQIGSKCSKMKSLGGIPRRLVSKEEDLFSSDFALSPRAVISMPPPRYCCHARRADRPVFYTMLIASLYPPHFATYLFSSLRGGTPCESGNNLWVYRGSNNSFLRGGYIYIQREEQKSIVYIVVDPREFVVLHGESNLR